MKITYVVYFLALFFCVKSDLIYEKNIRKLVESNGYPFETFPVLTEDNYILTLHRIPKGRNYETCKKRSPILIMHELFGSSENWISLGPEKSLGFRLASNCYDVWLGNQRGNMLSHKHLTLDPYKNASKFFDFSFHEIGYYDLPAMIDFILNKTKEKSIFYIGYSEGTAVFWVMASERPEYNSKIRFMQAMAPIAYLGNITRKLEKTTAYFWRIYKRFYEILGLYAIRISDFKKTLDNRATTCKTKSRFNILCQIFYKLNKYIPIVVLETQSARVSRKQLIHLAQEIRSHKFQKYDYGKKENLLRYGKIDPPHYNLARITTPISIFYANNDELATEKDVFKFVKKIPNLTSIFKVPSSTFTHTDFMYRTTEEETVKFLHNHMIIELNCKK